VGLVPALLLAPDGAIPGDYEFLISPPADQAVRQTDLLADRLVEQVPRGFNMDCLDVPGVSGQCCQGCLDQSSLQRHGLCGELLPVQVDHIVLLTRHALPEGRSLCLNEGVVLAGNVGQA